MNILITGGTGFLGQQLANELLKRGELTLDGTKTVAVDQIILADKTEPEVWQHGLRDNSNIEFKPGDISDQQYVDSLFQHPIDIVFHLASIVSSHGEQDFDLAFKINLDGTRYLFEAVRAQQNNTRVVFTSSLAAFGGDSMPDVVSDNTKLTPTTTYGITKTIGELLINDYTRKGFFDGRSARLPTVIIRPGQPNKAASSFVSGLFREPLNSEPCVIPVDPGLPMPVLGYRAIVDGIIKLAERDGNDLGTDRSVGLPAFNVTVQDLMDALKNVAGERNLGEHIMQPDAHITAICAGWPKSLDASRALALGLPIEASLEEIIEYYIEDFVEVGSV